MPPQEVLVLAMTRMKSGICTAGFTTERDEVTGLRWVRPIRDYDTVQPGDMTDPEGRLVTCCDVVELELVEPRPDPPHVEDWLTDFVHHRPRVVRRLEGDKRAEFFPQYLDRDPAEVLLEHKRSLCLVKPECVWASFSLDGYSGKYDARMGFSLEGDANHPRAAGRRGAPVTDLKWRELGRRWLGRGGTLWIDHDDLFERLGAEDVYLAVGLSRSWQGEYWPLVVGVHVVPDYGVDEGGGVEGGARSSPSPPAPLPTGRGEQVCRERGCSWVLKVAPHPQPLSPRGEEGRSAASGVVRGF